ncbi:MAG: cupin domain-containing protein [Steroidobacteraceae bacterium]
MGKVTKVDTARFSIAISRDLRMSLVEHQPGPPALCDGLIVAIADMTRTPPHGGELHPDGDELIYIISGKVRVIGESAPDDPCELRPGEACIVSKGEWHLVQILEPTRLVGITPGPGSDHRPVNSSQCP